MTSPLSQDLNLARTSYSVQEIAVSDDVAQGAFSHVHNPDAYSTHTGRRHAELNRYSNILPYDQNRVLLPLTGRTTVSTYVSASEMQLNTGISELPPFNCIVASAPTEDPGQLIQWFRLLDFIEIPVVVKLTNDVEGQRDKCYPYEGMSTSIGSISTEGQDTVRAKVRRPNTVGERLVQRILILKSVNGEERKIEQIHLENWPDWGTAHPQILLRLCKLILRRERTHDRPILFHCSAGVGRTGTLLACLLGIKILSHTNSLEAVDLIDLINRMRGQRAHMVQNRKQLQCIAQTLLLAEKELRRSNI